MARPSTSDFALGAGAALAGGAAAEAGAEADANAEAVGFPETLVRRELAAGVALPTSSLGFSTSAVLSVAAAEAVGAVEEGCGVVAAVALAGCGGVSTVTIGVAGGFDAVFFEDPA